MSPRPLLVGVLVVAAVATAADYVWYTFGVRHTVTSGVVHGMAVLTAVGGALGAASGRLWRGLPVGTLAGIAGAASYYAIVATVGGGTYGAAIPAAWVLTWLYLAMLEGRWVQAPRRRSWGSVATRGLLAALVAGLSFWTVMGVLWGPAPEGRNYLVQYLAWAFAWGPGMIALAAFGRRDVVIRRDSPVQAPSATAPALSAPSEQRDQGSITGPELLARIEAGEPLHILDVRTAGEFEAGHVPGAVNVPFTEISSRIQDVPGQGDQPLVVYCGHGPRAYIAAAALRRAGRTHLVYLKGHWSGWEAQGLRSEGRLH